MKLKKILIKFSIALTSLKNKKHSIFLEKNSVPLFSETLIYVDKYLPRHFVML